MDQVGFVPVVRWFANCVQLVPTIVLLVAIDGNKIQSTLIFSGLRSFVFTIWSSQHGAVNAILSLRLDLGYRVRDRSFLAIGSEVVYGHVISYRCHVFC